MNTVAPSHRWLKIALIVAVLAVGIGYILYTHQRGSAQGRPQNDSATEAQPSPIHADKVPQAIALLPSGYAFATSGELTIANTPSILPLSDYAADGNSLIGAEADLAQLVADSLGLRLQLVPVAWPDWPLGLTSGKYDAVISNITVTEERKKKFDFSTYRHDLLGLFTRKDGPIKTINGPRDVAGLTVAVGSSTNQDQILRRWDAQNVAAGLQPVAFQYVDDLALVQLALISGRTDVYFAPNAGGNYLSHSGQIHRVGLFSGGWPKTADIAITTRKGSGLAAAITAALNAQIANGNYTKVLKRWELTEEAIGQSQTNPPGLEE